MQSRELAFCSCTRGAKEGTDLFLSLEALGLSACAEFVEWNERGLATRYNAFLDAHAGRDAIVVFAHDDVAIEDPFVREKLVRGACRFAVQGLAGASSFNLQLGSPQTIWLRAPAEALSGAVEHVLSATETFWSSYGPVPRRCVVLDGLFLAVDLLKVGSVRFDETFDFDFYDLDFCLAAHEAGLALGTVNVHARHRSGGSFSGARYQERQESFRAKWLGRSHVGDPSAR